ncbi:MAG: 16S rRNA (uracil(1498)-N(3))-methyltransferase [Gallionella sp.]
MPRFYCSPPIPLSGSFDLPPDAAHHAARVLRLRVGDSVEIFDGLGNEYSGRISDLTGRNVTVANLAATGMNRESPLHVVLAQALTSSEKMDWIIQKSTELGVTEIQPIDTARSVARLSAERATKRMEHWQQVAISACEQCGRNVLPKIHAPLDIMVWLQQTIATPSTQIVAAKYILQPEGAATLHDQAVPQGKVVLLIGAEGGFSEAEGTVALQCGFTSIRLGARVMRTETAAVAGLTVLQTLWGDF